jgi:hypothetical protein
MCDNFAMAQRLYLDQFTSMSDEPVARWRVLETGFRTSRGLSVSRLELWIVELTDAYDPRRITAYRTEDEALSEAERLRALPDSRGFLREWMVDDGSPSGGPMIHGGRL